MTGHTQTVRYERMSEDKALPLPACSKSHERQTDQDTGSTTTRTSNQENKTLASTDSTQLDTTAVLSKVLSLSGLSRRCQKKLTDDCAKATSVDKLSKLTNDDALENFLAPFLSDQDLKRYDVERMFDELQRCFDRPCRLERATDSFLKQLPRMVKVKCQRSTSKPKPVAHHEVGEIMARFLSLTSLYHSSIVDRMNACPRDTASGGITVSPAMTQKTRQKCRKSAELLVLAMCVRWDIRTDAQAMRKVTTFVLRFCFVLSKLRTHQLKGETFMIDNAVTAARHNEGHLFHSHTQQQLAFCCGTLAGFFHIDEQRFAELL